MGDGNRQIVLMRRPQGVPRAEDFGLRETAVPEARPGEMVIRNRVLSMDAAIRGFLEDRPSYIEPIALGDVVRGMTLGEVVESRLDGFKPGDHVSCMAGWEEFSRVNAQAIGLSKCEPRDGRALSLYMGALGPTGLTAYVALHGIGHIRAGETVLISAAAGAVGNMAGQIAKIHGCTVIGITGGAEKAAACLSLGYDHVIDYKKAPDLARAIAAVAPQGVDLYLDNVGGQVLDAALLNLAIGARVVVSGMISNYNNADSPTPIHNLWQVLVKRATITGFLTFEHPGIVAEASEKLDDWIARGLIKPLENITHGITAAPQAFIRLMSGQTIGKTVVCIDPRLPEGLKFGSES